MHSPISSRNSFSHEFNCLIKTLNKSENARLDLDKQKLTHIEIKNRKILQNVSNIMLKVSKSSSVAVALTEF